ncbi:MAG: hypothetical protein O8C58_01100 [Candidatus Methanoperedens sp.]|nr:hypothetical protein [Candidatus Methanoperedens sp.]
MNTRHRRKENLKLQDVIRTKHDLFLLKQSMLPILENMGISRIKINQFPIRFGEKREFKKDSDAFYTKQDIVIRRGLECFKALSNLAHEYGHEVTLTGGVGTKSNIVGEMTAYNFQKAFLCNFNNSIGTSLKLSTNKPYLIRLIINPLYTLAMTFSFIPLGKFIKSKYTHEN